MNGKSVVERALELAGTGAYRSIDDIKRRLGGEGYAQVDAHLAGQAIRRQLKARMSGKGNPET